MNLKVTSKTPAPLLMRTVMEAELDYDKATPSNDDVKKKLAAAAGANPGLVVIKKIDNKYGVRKAIVTAYVYENEEAMKKIEPKSKKAEAKPAEKKEEAPAEKKEEPAKEEKPAEKKEEAPKEEKPAEEKKGE